MSLSQHKFREIVFQWLFSTDMGKPEEEDLAPFLMKELVVSRKNVKLAYEKSQEILNNLEELDKLIAQNTTSYEFERIPSVERNLLRLGVYELLFDEAIPDKVAIAEAMRLGRKYSNPESSTFINAILDNVFKNHKKGAS